MRTISLLLAFAGIALSGETALKVKPGQTAPRFLLLRLDDDSRRVGLREFADSARRAANPAWGKPVVLAFWSTTCVNCRVELPRLQKWADTRDVAFLPMLVENAEPADGIRWLDGVGVTARGLHDRYQVVGRNYGVCEGNVCTVPALVAITPDGCVKLSKSGYFPAEPLEAQLDSALGTAPARDPKVSEAAGSPRR